MVKLKKKQILMNQFGGVRSQELEVRRKPRRKRRIKFFVALLKGDYITLFRRKVSIEIYSQVNN